MDLVDVHRRLLSGADPCRASVARAVRDGLTLDALRPRSDAGRGRRSGGWEKTQLAQGGYRQGGTATRGAAVLRLHRRPAHEGRRSMPKVRSVRVGRKAARREAASLLRMADRRMVRRLPCNIGRKPAHVEAAALAVSQPCRGHEAGRGDRPVCNRQAHSDRLVEDGAQRAVRPSCPAEEAINLNHQTGVQRPKRSTPIRRTGVQREKALGQLQPAGLDRGRRTGVNSVLSARAACEGLITPLRQHSLVGDRGRAIHPPVMPVQQGSRTQVSMVGNLGKA